MAIFSVFFIYITRKYVKYYMKYACFRRAMGKETNNSAWHTAYARAKKTKKKGSRRSLARASK